MVNENYGNKEEIGRKGGVGSSGATMQRDQTAGQKVKQGWHELKAKLTGKWNRLDSNELDTYSSRPRNDLVGYVHSNVGGDRNLIERDIDTFSRETNYKW